MEYLLSIKQRLANAQYVNENSVSMFRLLLLDTATFLTNQYRSNSFLKKDPVRTGRLLQLFQNVKEYYHILTRASLYDVQCYQQIRLHFEKDIEALENIFKTNVYPLQSMVPMSIAR